MSNKMILNVVEQNEMLFIDTGEGITKFTKDVFDYLFSLLDEDLNITCRASAGHYPNSWDSIKISCEGIEKVFEFDGNSHGKTFEFKFSLPTKKQVFIKYLKECKELVIDMVETFNKLKRKTYQIEI